MRLFDLAVRLTMSLVCGTAWSLAAVEGDDAKLDTATAKACYAFGMDMGRSVAGMADELYFEVDVKAMLRGLEDTLTRRKLLLTDAEAGEAKAVVVGGGKKLRFQIGEKNKKAAEEFLAGNKTKEGIVMTGSGLQYAVLRAGEGDNPRQIDTVRVHYRGTMLDGTEFVDTHKKGEPEEVVVSKVLPGMTEALQLLRVGSQYRLFVPPSLGYGQRGRGRIIGPHALLLYDVELLAIEPEKPTGVPASGKGTESNVGDRNEKRGGQPADGAPSSRPSS